MAKLAEYNKLWVALILSLAFVAMKYYDVLPQGLDDIVTETIKAALISYGVWAVPNRSRNA